MRVDGRQEGIRQSMSWLHTWSGLILGWLLFAIFFTGTLSFFQNEITTWMKPELHKSLTNQSRESQLTAALTTLQERAPNASGWSINLPETRQTVTTINIRAQGEDPRARRGGERLTLDSTTGEVIDSRDTRGGGFLYRFHFELYGLERGIARWIVGFATLFMLVAIVSGIITHKKIFKDFFTFRPRKGQRSWLDAHNATAVFALPFHIMITFSGLLLLLFTIFPWGVNERFESRQQFLQAQNGMQIAQTRGENIQGRGETRESSNGTVQRENRRQRTEVGGGNRGEMRGRERGASFNPENNRTGRDARVQLPTKPYIEMTPIIPLWQQAQAQFSDKSVTTISIINPNTADAEIEIRAAETESLANRRLIPSMKFNGVTGAVITTQDVISTPTIPASIYNWLTTLHEARGIDLGLRWLLFLSGVMGTLMIATGLVLWVVKRIPEQQKLGRITLGYRGVQIVNVAAISGLMVATASFFFANRFVPALQPDRATQEIHIFFIVWAATFIHAAIRLHRHAWLEQLAISSAMFGLLPLLNALTGGRGLWSSIYEGQWVVASFDLMALSLATILGWAFYRLKKSPVIQIVKPRIRENSVAVMEQA